MRRGAPGAREMFTVWAPVALIVTAGFRLAYRYVGAPAPRVIRDRHRRRERRLSRVCATECGVARG
jgi:hypothetical protein